MLSYGYSHSFGHGTLVVASKVLDRLWRFCVATDWPGEGYGVSVVLSSSSTFTFRRRYGIACHDLEILSISNVLELAS